MIYKFVFFSWECITTLFRCSKVLRIDLTIFSFFKINVHTNFNFKVHLKLRIILKYLILTGLTVFYFQDRNMEENNFLENWIIYIWGQFLMWWPSSNYFVAFYFKEVGQTAKIPTFDRTISIIICTNFFVRSRSPIHKAT